MKHSIGFTLSAIVMLAAAPALAEQQADPDLQAADAAHTNHGNHHAGDKPAADTGAAKANHNTTRSNKASGITRDDVDVQDGSGDSGSSNDVSGTILLDPGRDN